MKHMSFTFKTLTTYLKYLLKMMRGRFIVKITFLFLIIVKKILS